MKNSRISTGIDGLDEILKGGFHTGTCTIIAAPVAGENSLLCRGVKGTLKL